MEVETPTYENSISLDVDDPGADGLASRFESVQVKEANGHSSIVKSSKGKGKKKKKKFQIAAGVEKLQSLKKHPDKMSDSCKDWDIGEGKTSPLVAGD